MLKPQPDHDFGIRHRVVTRVGRGAADLWFCRRCGRGKLPYVMAAPCLPVPEEEVQVRIERKIRMLQGLSS